MPAEYLRLKIIYTYKYIKFFFFLSLKTKMVDMIFLYLAWKTMHNLHNYLHFSRTLVGGNQSHDLNTLTAGFHEKNIVNGKLFAHETGIQSPLRHHLKYCLTIYKDIYSNNICIRKKKKK